MDVFPIPLWDRLLPQAEITLNLLRQSNATSNVSAYAHLYGPFHYNKIPLAPMGSKSKSTRRQTIEARELSIWWMVGTFTHHQSIIEHTSATSKTQDHNG